MTNRWAGKLAAILFAAAMSSCAPADENADAVSVAETVEGGVDTRTLLADDLAELTREVNAEHGGTTGIAVSHPDGVVAAGAEGLASAWSTIKVPIAIAAAQEGTATDWLIDAAITESDNSASTQLWNSLNGEVRAAHAVEQVMWRAGGPGDVRSAVTHLEGGPYGNSTWPLASQAQFATQLPCVPGAEPVYDAMARIAEWQDDGLGRLDGAHFKGGWSEEMAQPDGYTYTYRQFGTVPASNGGVVGLAIIAHPEDGTHETAAAMLDDLARGAGKLVDDGTIPATQACLPR